MQRLAVLRERGRSRAMRRLFRRIAFPPPAAAFASFGAGSVICAPARVELPGRIHIGSRTVVHEHVWFSVVASFPERPPTLRIGDRVRIGRFCRISCVGDMVIEDDVLISDCVHVADTYHRYDVPGLIPLTQPMREPSPVRIARGATIDYGACILMGVTVGAFAHVLPRSVVVADVPAGAIVSGNPARVMVPAR